MARKLTTKSRIRGSLLGGAVGDALGAPVEFFSNSDIRAKFGAGGIRDFSPAFGIIGAITDDTQMALFTADGLIRSYVRWANKGLTNDALIIHHAYLRWLITQGGAPTGYNHQIGDDGWLLRLKPIHAIRAPGNTCLAALRDTKQLGIPTRNNSKGCGGIMRTAPLGLALLNADRSFELSCQISELTHGHRTATLSAGFLSELIFRLIDGVNLHEALELGKRRLMQEPESRETLNAIGEAEEAARRNPASVETLEQLGSGWVAEEALAISLFSVLATRNFEEAVCLAVNHSGDSDSTGAITGNIAGAIYGEKAIPERWANTVELGREILRIANDLWAVRTEKLAAESSAIWKRYPGW